MKFSFFSPAELARQEGLEPATYCLEGSCSIQLSYETIFLSGWQDSNLRPPAPKAGAITGLRYTPQKKQKSGETGTRTLATVTRRQISNLLRYHSGTSPIIVVRTYLFCGCKCIFSFLIIQHFREFFSINFSYS